MSSRHNANHRFVFGAFMLVALVTAALPTRERQLYLFDCSTSDGLVTRVVDRFAIDSTLEDRTRRSDPIHYASCLPGSGLLANRILSPDEEFANAPLYGIARVVGASRTVLGRLAPARQLTAARNVPGRPGTPTPIEDQSAALVAADPLPSGAVGGGGAGPGPDLASVGSLPGTPVATPPLALTGFTPGSGGSGLTPIGFVPPPGNPDPGVTPPDPAPPVTTPVNPPVPPVLVAVPEPSAWALMLLGFFALGRAMRIRRPLVAAA